jgi:hypothetical protein
MAQLDDEIDRLYQLPAAEFVAARNALAKQAGPGAATVKDLQKPNAPAWAVNQLYWTLRKTFDKLIDAANKLRAAHSQMLSGKRADVTAAEAAHRDAVKAASAEVREILSQAGDPATAATMMAVNDTLQALPGPERPGRLVRPLKPRGFEALAGLVPGAAAASKRLAEIVQIVRGRAIVPIARGRAAAPERTAKESAGDTGKLSEAAARRAEAEAKRQAEIKKQHLEKLDAEIRAARSAERQAETTLSRTRDALARVERQTEELKKELEALSDKAQDLAEQARRQEIAARQASTERMRLEERRG